MEKIKIGDDEIYLKKSFDGWRVTYPPKNDDGTWNYKNLIFGGNVWNFVKILIVILLIIAVIVIYHYDTETCRETLLHINDTCMAYKTTYITTNPDPSKLILPNITNATG